LLIGGPTPRAARRPHGLPLRLERLEDRLAPAVFNVNSLADVLNPSAGVVTLRSAVQAANTNADATNTINLTLPGNYAITLPGTAGEVDNAAGEFAIFSTNLTTGSAKTNLTIANTSGGAVTVDGGRLARVFDVNPSLQLGSVNITAGGTGFTGASGITFSAPTLAGGIQATGTLIVSAGTVVGVRVTNPGTGYTTSAPPTFTFTGPGTGAAGNLVLTSPKLSVSLSGFTVQNGLAQPGDLAAGSGGGIRDLGNANLTLTNMVVTGNSASADGGGVVMEDSSGGTDFLGGSTNPTLTVNNSTISNNHAGDAGGGIDADGAGTVTINAGTVVSGNTDLNQGAGVYLDGIANALTGVTVTAGGSGYTSAPLVNFGGPGTGAAGFATVAGGVVTGVTITNSGSGYTSAPTVTFVGGGSGATATAAVVASQTANLNMTGTLVNGNTSTGTANGLGGGISNAGNGAVTIIGCTVENNFAATTGGGFSDENNGLGTLNVVNSYFFNNSAVGNGGGIFFSGPSATITGTSLRGNTTNASGGGLFAAGTTLTVTGSDVVNNTASTNGGGVEVQTTGTGANGSAITNSTITGNNALNNAGGANGGGLDAPAALTGRLALLNDTVNGNFADNGGGVFWAGTGGGFSAQNTIVARNTASTTGPDARNPAGAFTDNGGNLIGSTSGNTGLVSVSTAAPMLGPLQNNGGPAIGAAGTLVLETEALLPGSPALDRGVAAGAPATDERGFARPDAGTGDKADVGAFEFQDTTLAVSITPSAATVPPGGNDTFTVTVTNTGGNALPADNSTVSVTLSAGLSAAAGSPTTFTLSPLAAGQSQAFMVTATANVLGSQTATATLTSADANPNSVSNSTNVTVTAAATMTALTVVPNPATVGQSVTLTATVTSAAGTPAGSVQFMDGPTLLKTVALSGGSAVFSTSFAAGSHTLTAVYTGSPAFAGSTSSPAVALAVHAPQTIGVFDPATATWYLRSSNSAGAPDAGQFQYGPVGSVPVTGNWSGAGPGGIGAFDPATATWFLRNEDGAGAPDAGVFQYGGTGFVPFTGDWNNSGHTGVGVFDPTTATWFLRNEPNAGPPDAGAFRYGVTGGIPVVGDWTGTGHLGIGIFDPATATWFLRSSATAGAPDVGVFRYGGVGFRAVAGDWTGAGHAGIGAFDPISATFFLRNEPSAGAPDAGQFAFGGAGFLPVVGTFPPLVQHLLADGGEGPGGAVPLGAAELQSAVAAALAQVSASGAAPALQQRLASAEYDVGDLPPGVLGLADVGAGRVMISADAAGYGWIADGGRMDLQTALLHEMGHLAGLPDEGAASRPGDLMADSLAPGAASTQPLDLLFAQAAALA
jgi:hypothetical protein